MEFLTRIVLIFAVFEGNTKFTCVSAFGSIPWKIPVVARRRADPVHTAPSLGSTEAVCPDAASSHGRSPWNTALSDVTACPDPADVEKVNSIARGLGALSSQIPPKNFSNPAVIGAYNQLLTALCTTYRPNLDNISAIVGACPAIAFQANDLLTLTFLDRSFTALYLNFADIDEFCACTPHLVSAWAIEDIKDQFKTTVQNGAFSTVANLEVYCSTGYLPNAVADVATGQAVCRPLWKEAGLTSSTIISEIKNFVDNRCANLDTDKLQCAITKSSETNFVSCSNNPDTDATVSDSGTGSSDDMCSAKCCGRRACVSDHIEPSCGVVGQDLFIDVVNLQRPAAEYLISTSECTSAGAAVTRMSVMAAVGLCLLLIFTL